MAANLVIGCVGKPNAGKSSFLNAATDANAKVGNFPFCTIEPNHGVTYYTVNCPCVKYGKSDLCSPHYGRCENGVRYIPIKMIDVAGLVPGASEGKGLGNQFLDDLRTADVLLHIVDVSGTTNEKGEATKGYDPLRDIEWLQEEIHLWIFNNLWKKWSNIVRRHTATKSTALNTLQSQFSGYGTKPITVQKTLDAIGVKEPSDMETWDEGMVHKLVDAFLKERFPTILVLNKVDMSDSDQNIRRICAKYPDAKLVPCSALVETFLRKLVKQGFIRYSEGSEFFDTYEDDVENGVPEAERLKEPDSQLKGRLNKIKDLVLFRYGSTGVAEAIKQAVETRKLIPVYPVKNLTSFSSSNKDSRAFQECILVHPGTTVREFAKFLNSDLDKYFAYAENPERLRLGENDEITLQNNIIKYTTLSYEKETKKDKSKEKEKSGEKSGEKKEKEKKENK